MSEDKKESSVNANGETPRTPTSDEAYHVRTEAERREDEDLYDDEYASYTIREYPLPNVEEEMVKGWPEPDMDACLEPQHKKIILDSAINPAVAKWRGYRSVTIKAELYRLGFGKSQQLVPALLIPVRDSKGVIVLNQIKPDSPRIGEKGRPNKYESPFGSHLPLDIHPFVRKDIGNPAIPLYVTEGCRKVDSGISRGLCCLGVFGVNAWGGPAALPGWDSVALEDRDVSIVFDSDVSIKPEVRKAQKALSAFLVKRGAKVSIIDLPHGA